MSEEIKIDAPVGKWYTLQTLSSYELRVKDALENMCEINELQDKIFDIEVVIDEIVEYKGGKKRKRQKKVLPSYVFINMVYDKDLMYDISNIEGVLNFVSNSKGPTPIPDKEISRIISRVNKDRFDIEFQENSSVKIIEGPFKDFVGQIKEIFPEKSRMKVVISVFGRNTPVELSFAQVVPVTDRRD